MALKQIKKSAPVQWEGFLHNGKFIFIEYKYNKLYVGIGDKRIDAVMNKEEIFANTNTEYGFIDEKTMLNILENILKIYRS